MALAVRCLFRRFPTSALSDTRIAFSTTKFCPNAAVPLPSNEKVYPEKIVQIVEDISKLNLLEVADLNSLLKSRLNISDAPVMMAGAMAGAPPAQQEEEEEEVAPQAIQTSFTVKLQKYDETKKVAIIKEIKNLVEGMNLVQAKKFVESCPAVVKADIAKDEAEKMKEALAAVGGEVVVE
uniref:Mitochondrial 39S ribosomal protein L12 n=1 Tax=Pseudodiaptomus poplesia TaxID=213370 RepID=A0A1S6GLE5_9MAXI|nr:mitochondrial 39S ribosomal protein L12 [Pseudodiaptomus poplesia]